MEMKEERTGDRVVHESYRILMESDAIMRSHRTLRREICISRIIIFILLFICMASCAILYTQQVHRGKNNENMNKETNEYLTDHSGATRDDAVSWIPPLASLNIPKRPTSAKANLTWAAYHNQMNDMCPNDTCETLIIPEEGKYRLSLQITYGDISDEEEQINLAHRIITYSDSYMRMPMTILSVTETVFKNKAWFKTVSSEVFYVFNKGDRVKVESENAMLIDVSGYQTTKNLLTVHFVSRLRKP